jgi:hypothetical protein
VGEGVFYDDEGGAPEERAEDEREVGFDGGGLGVGGGRCDGDRRCERASGLAVD